MLALSGRRVGTFLGVCYERNLAAARIWRREGQGTDCGDGFSLPRRCALIRDRVRSECSGARAVTFLGVCDLLTSLNVV